MSVLPRKYRRRSALQAFACPAHFKGVYVDGHGHETHPSRRGTAFHLAVRRYIDLLREHQCDDDADLAAQAKREALAAAQVPFEGIQEVDELWARFVPGFRLDIDHVLMHEERPDDEYDWQPDLVRVMPGGVLEVVDFKTHFVVLTEDAARAAFQVAFYSARARRVWPNFEIYRFSLWFVRWGVIVHVELTPAEIDRHEEHLAILEAGIATALDIDEWPAVPGETCMYCDLVCPVADAAVVHPVRLQTREDAERMFGEYLALERAAKARWTVLERWAGFEGPIRLNGLELAPIPTTKVEFPIDRVLSVFEAHGLEPSFSVTRTTLKPYLTQVRYRHLASELTAVSKEKPGSTTYRVRKVGDVAPPGVEE